MNKSQGSTVGSAAKDLGFSGMWAGLGPRIIMIGTLTALQWFIYDSVKVIIEKKHDLCNLHAYFKLNLKFIFRSFSASLAHPHQKCPNLWKRSLLPSNNKHPHRFYLISFLNVEPVSSKFERKIHPTKEIDIRLDWFSVIDIYDCRGALIDLFKIKSKIN